MMAQTPCARRDLDHHAAYSMPPADVVGRHPARVRPGPAAGAGRGGRIVGRSPLLRAFRGVLLRPSWSAVDPDGDLPADDVLEVPVPVRVRDLVRRGGR